MTILEFSTAVHELLPDSSTATEVVVWHRRNKLDVQYSAWSDKHNRHFGGATPEEVIANIREFLAPSPFVDGDIASIDSLGELPIAEVTP